MDSVMLIMTLTLFLTMTATNGQPSGCICYNGGINPACYARGCSRGNNPSCNNGHYAATGGDRGFSFSSLNFLNTNGYTGCNCPGYSYNNNNGFYHDLSSRSGYNYDTCTSYGLNARDHNDDVPGGANAAIDCCNYCCNSNDPYHPTIITTIKTIPTTAITNTVPITIRSTTNIPTAITNTVPITTRSTTNIPTATTTTFRRPAGCDCFTGGYSFDYYSGGSSCGGSSSCSSCGGCSGGSCCSGVSRCCITDCCNYCCNRHDPDTTTKPTSTAISTTINTTTIAATSGDREIILNNSLYLSALTMLVLATLKIN